MTQIKIYITSVLLLTISLVRCQDMAKMNGYVLNTPEQTLKLPKSLFEISGLTAMENGNFACVQDEKGIVFIYDPKRNEIVHQYNFHLDGDYEGITEAQGSIYILRSDGELLEISNFDGANFNVSSYKTNIPAKDNEGLCFDSKNQRLLIASKSKPSNEPKNTSKRVIYGFDLKSKTLTLAPVFEFDVNELEAYAKKHNIELPEKTKKNGSQSKSGLKFKTSAVAIHPISNELYVISARDRFLFIFETDGSVKEMIPLDKNLFNKAEGITFYTNGDMLITNEGNDDDGREKAATALRFKYTKN